MAKDKFDRSKHHENIVTVIDDGIDPEAINISEKMEEVRAVRYL